MKETPPSDLGELNYTYQRQHHRGPITVRLTPLFPLFPLSLFISVAVHRWRSSVGVVIEDSALSKRNAQRGSWI